MPPEFQKFINLSVEQKAAAYNELYKVVLTQGERDSRPVHIKADRVNDILKGDVTPGCSSREWFTFFSYLNSQIDQDGQ